MIKSWYKKDRLFDLIIYFRKIPGKLNLMDQPSDRKSYIGKARYTQYLLIMARSYSTKVNLFDMASPHIPASWTLRSSKWTMGKLTTNGIKCM